MAVTTVIRNIEVTISDAVIARFWAKVERGHVFECWLYKPSKNSNTHGKVSVYGRPHPNEYAHRLAWILTNGDIPDGLFVLHRCDMPPCCNPAHLFLGTQQDNLRDMREKKRDAPWAHHTKPARGTKHWKARLTPEGVREIRAMVAGGMSQQAVANYCGVFRTTIQAVVSRRTWGHVT